jgi:acyl-CoA thioester hydrolase
MVRPKIDPEDTWHETDIRIRYKDTDRMGVVYYGNYLTFFEVGRAEYMRSLGFPYSELEGNGYTLAVTDATAKYHGNVGYDALVTVKTRICKLTRVQVRFSYLVMDEEDNLLVSGETGHACINEKMKACRLPEELVSSLDKAVQ